MSKRVMNIGEYKYKWLRELVPEGTIFEEEHLCGSYYDRAVTKYFVDGVEILEETGSYD